MKIFWIGSDKEYTEYLIEYAARLDYQIPKDANLLASIDDDGSLKGFGAISATKDVADILFLYVTKECRRQGIGGKLLSEIESLALQAGVSSIRCFVPHEDSNLTFFTKKGYELCEGPREYAVSMGALWYSESYRKIIYGKTAKKAKALGNCSSMEKKALKHYCEMNGISGLDFFDQRISSVIFSGDEVTTLFLGESNNNGVIIHYIHLDKAHPEFMVDCFKVLDRAVNADINADSKLMLSFATGNENELSLLSHIAGEAAIIEEFSRYAVAFKNIGSKT